MGGEKAVLADGRTSLDDNASSGIETQHAPENTEKHNENDPSSIEGLGLEKTSTGAPSIDTLANPPDGGLNAWLKVLGCFLIYSNIWQVILLMGFTLTFGAFQVYYQHNFLSTSSPSAISWIGTIQSWLLILVGVLSGPLFDLGWFRPMLFAGNLLVIFGIFMLSLSKNYWQVFLSQGVCMGLGAGLLYVPSLALIGLSFSKKRSLAQGITTSGIAVGMSFWSFGDCLVANIGSIGSVAYIFAFSRVTESASFGRGVRVMGFVAVGIAAIAFPALLSGTSALAKARTARDLFDLAAFKDRGFLIFTACTFSTFLGYIVPYFFMSAYAQDALGLDTTFSMYILIMSIAASFFGRLFVGIMALKVGPILTWFSCTLVSGILSMSWIAVRTRSGHITFSVFWGFCSGGLVTLPAAVFPHLCPDMKKLGTRTGMSWGISSFATLVGSPIAGALVKVHREWQSAEQSRLSYLGPQLWAGAFLLFGSAIICLLWIDTKRRMKTSWLI